MTTALRAVTPPPGASLALPPDLPCRPRLDPARETAWRSADAVQFGITGQHAVVVEGLTTPLARMVATLDGSRRVEDVVADAVAGGGALAPVCALLTRLHAAGLLAGDGPATTRLGPDAAALGTRARPGDAGLGPRAHAFVVVHGAGRVGVAVACLLAGAGVGRVQVVADGLVLGRDTGCGLLGTDVGRPRARAAADAVARAAPGVVTSGAGRSPDLVVLADGPVPDPPVVAELAAQRRAHLAVAVHDGLGVVGPLVLPGRSGCLRCADLHRTDADPAWPAVAAQLARRRPGVALSLASAVAALAAEQALATLDPTGTAGVGRAGAGTVGPPPVIDAVLELDPRAGTLRRRHRPPHPGCPCRPAAVATADAVVA